MPLPLIALAVSCQCQELRPDAYGSVSAGPLVLTATEGLIRVTRQGVRVLDYQYGNALPKPFVQPLATPSGQPVTMAGPPDHVHHRGLMFALGNVAFAGEEARYVVFWGEQGAPERLGQIVQVPGSEQLRADLGKPKSVSFAARNEWRRNSDQALMLTERRRITVYDVGDRTLLTWDTELTAPERDIVLGPTEGRDVSYYGLGLRTPHDLDGGAILDANGKQGEAEVLGDDADWCAYVGPNDPKRGFAMFDHAANPRHPTGWFVMSAGFGYMTASLVCHEPFALPKGQSVRLRYGVCAFDGSPTADEVGQWYEAWVRLEP
jgi:hypothetical protein